MSEPRIDVVAAGKGGVGKTTLAYEIAFQRDAVLVDLDWDRGGATKAWGYRIEQRVRSSLLDAIESGGKKVPRFLDGKDFKPDLLPGHRDFGVVQPEPEAMANLLEQWAREWGRDIVVDTHPGGVPSTLGALSVARSVVLPTTFQEKPMEALEGFVEDLPDYPLMIVPNIVKGLPPDRYVKWMRRVSEQFKIPIVQHVDEYTWIGTRTLRKAISSEPIPRRAEEFVLQVGEIVREMERM